MDEVVKIRQMEARDAAAASALCSQLGYERRAGQVAAWIEGMGAEQAAFVAVVEGEVVGWVEVSVARHLQTEAHALIGGLVVCEGMRGLKIGRRLCEAVERWSLERGVGVLRVTSRSTREEAHRFYLRDGYGVVKTSVVFEKKLVR